MPQSLADRLTEAVESALPKLHAITEPQALVRRPGDWTRKQELGHLLDSATNNRLRFVRATLEAGYSGPPYAQNGWVDLHDYNSVPWPSMVEFWSGYNRLLSHLILNIPEASLPNSCVIGEAEPVTLEFLIADYVEHMQHHLDHITCID